MDQGLLCRVNRERSALKARAIPMGNVVVVTSGVSGVIGLVCNIEPMRDRRAARGRDYAAAQARDDKVTVTVGGSDPGRWAGPKNAGCQPQRGRT